MNPYNPGEHYICTGISHREGQIIEITRNDPGRIHYVVISANPDLTDRTNQLNYSNSFRRNSTFDNCLTLHTLIEPDIFETELPPPQTFFSLFTP